MGIDELDARWIQHNREVCCCYELHGCTGRKEWIATFEDMTWQNKRALASSLTINITADEASRTANLILADDLTLDLAYPQ